MPIKITDAEWEKLDPENFDTYTLLDAVAAVDKMRDHLNDGEDGRPPELRTDLLKLHQVAMDVFNHRYQSRIPDLFDLAFELEDQVDSLMELLEQVRGTLSRLTALYPESLAYR
jgi:hypothetical protein